MSDQTNMPPIGVSEMADGSDPITTLNMRDWMRRACEDAGAKFTGGSFGCGEADIDIELEGHRYNVTIKPIVK